MLAVEGLGNDTNCDSQGHTFVDWTKMTPDGRPRSFRRREITDELIALARQAGNSAAAVEVRVVAANLCWFHNTHRLRSWRRGSACTTHARCCSRGCFGHQHPCPGTQC